VNGYASMYSRGEKYDDTGVGSRRYRQTGLWGSVHWVFPTVLVTNESTLSDGEDFTRDIDVEAWQVVGEPTAGWIIFTRVDVA